MDEFDAPDELNVDERNVWLRLAPEAFEKGTLTKAWSYAFVLLCQNIVLERKFRQSVMDVGGASHRGVIQIIDRELLRFNLSPCGKSDAAVEDATAIDPMEAKYFG